MAIDSDLCLFAAGDTAGAGPEVLVDPRIDRDSIGDDRRRALEHRAIPCIYDIEGVVARSAVVGAWLGDGIPGHFRGLESSSVDVPEGEAVGRRDEGRRQCREGDRSGRRS